MITAIIGAAFLCLVSGAEYDDRLCKKEQEECGEFSYIFQRLLEPGLEEFLQANCSYLLNNVLCHMNLRQKCPLTDERLEFKILQGYFSAFTVICDEKSALRKALFRNLECYKKHIDTQEYCEDERFQPVLNFARWETNSTKVREELFLTSKYICLYSTLRRYCVVRKMDLDCGREAAIAANEILYLLEEENCPAEMTVIWLDQLLEFLWNNFSKE